MSLKDAEWFLPGGEPETLLDLPVTECPWTPSGNVLYGADGEIIARFEGYNLQGNLTELRRWTE